ncbi:unnamed protein product [Vitrella brassicaformis CCMP3155]|uniref:NYN domain-containing protein n=1 Tax=Vitrella brassicaformis (strain CCMP3155) TaxID=1169540 RepID=A0A0G4FXJ8_VITBC|nr:unnamed protein product [Vitrella brassicaformis CCMP3155]|eukprot:CEM19585.1 unnamed protein product [Vitrella brassicaformis CCMP3155]
MARSSAHRSSQQRVLRCALIVDGANFIQGWYKYEKKQRQTRKVNPHHSEFEGLVLGMITDFAAKTDHPIQLVDGHIIFVNVDPKRHLDDTAWSLPSRYTGAALERQLQRAENDRNKLAWLHWDLSSQRAHFNLEVKQIGLKPKRVKCYGCKANLCHLVQKGADPLIASFLTQAAVEPDVHGVILFSGDADFKPTL